MPFDLAHLSAIRDHEIDSVARFFPAGARVLEVGAGTGEQARALTARGFSVTAVDVRQSGYAAHRVFPVIDYDGKFLPVADSSVEVVFSSNVLEHIVDIATFHAEARRVLRPNGIAIHLMPTTAWRFWTTVSGFADILPAIRPELAKLIPWPLRRSTLRRAISAAFAILRAAAARVLPVRHGESGNALTELYWFSRTAWRANFNAGGWSVIDIKPSGLFYTGWMVFGSRLSLERRAHLAKFLGSACSIYFVRPKP